MNNQSEARVKNLSPPVSVWNSSWHWVEILPCPIIQEKNSYIWSQWNEMPRTACLFKVTFLERNWKAQNQALIQDFGQGGASTVLTPMGGGGWAQNLLKIGVFSLKLPENCMILNKSWGKEGPGPPGPPGPPGSATENRSNDSDCDRGYQRRARGRQRNHPQASKNEESNVDGGGGAKLKLSPRVELGQCCESWSQCLLHHRLPKGRDGGSLHFREQWLCVALSVDSGGCSIHPDKTGKSLKDIIKLKRQFLARKKKWKESTFLCGAFGLRFSKIIVLEKQ